MDSLLHTSTDRDVEFQELEYLSKTNEGEGKQGDKKRVIEGGSDKSENIQLGKVKLLVSAPCLLVSLFSLIEGGSDKSENTQMGKVKLLVSAPCLLMMIMLLMI